ncbi:NAD(P)/FAD-dependent oxidoreductase [candidate division KSB1 bacterium]|nr:NAD(P)/FAD-dependent oxidoreductase [candidate division KSB1 bacterium]
MLKDNDKTADYSGIPSVGFTIPPLASVGLQERTANELGLEKYSGFKTLVEEGSNRILGAHVLGPHAEEVINIFALAIRNEIPAGDVRRMIYAYPTSSSDVSYMV